MLVRKLSTQLSQWKNNVNRKCLLVKGARQVGKTTTIDKFAKENYKHYVYINFDQTPEYQSIFDGNLDTETLIKKISLVIPSAELVPGETIIFLDEIQECPNARTALKFLTIDGRFDVIASGSMLGIKYKEVRSYPVGQVDYIEMHSLDFEEFLWAIGITENSIADIKEYFDTKTPVPAVMHNKMMELLKEYIVIGGMPAVVQEFVNTQNFSNVLRLQKNIISDYEDDIAKYAEDNQKAKAKACFRSIPKHLSKDFKKFQYSIVEKGGSARKYGGSLDWLYDAGIINFCNNLEIPELPLEGNSISSEFKVYMRDTGLLIAMLDEGTAMDIIKGNLGIYKGAIFENIIADIFTKSGRKLYYYEKNNRLEIDFFIRLNSMAVGVEVKSADNTKSKSLDTLIGHYGVEKGIKLSAKNIGGKDRVESLPLYMAMFL
ncbi:MAG: AAA family ATPase [Oscillospiraceae bacterium]|nr:AAA family ATPase [Oscillospiraceae bacterium]